MSADDAVDLTPHPLAPRLDSVEADGQEAAFSILVGFIGPARQASRVRVYLDLSFGSYCELATGDVVRTRPVDPTDDEGPVAVSVRSSAEMQLVQIGRVTGTADFVTGAIRSSYARRAVYQKPYVENSVICPSSPSMCPFPGPPQPATPLFYCPTQIWCESVDVC
jgi:hypothetical protein